MLINRAAAWALVITNLSLPVTLRVTHRAEALKVTPTISTALAKTTPAETIQPSLDVPLQDPEDPPSTSSALSNISTQQTTVEAQKKAETIKHTVAQKKLEISHPEHVQRESLRIIGTSHEQCVIYVRRVTGNAKIRGYAGNLKPEGKEPQVGAVALDRRYGHVAVVIAIEGDWLIIHDANYKKGFITERRVHKSTQRGYIY